MIKVRLPVRPTGCGFHGVVEWEQAVSVCPKHKLAPLKTPLDRFRVTPNYILRVLLLILRVYAKLRCPHRKWQDAAGRCSPPVPTRSSFARRTCGRCGHAHLSPAEHADDAVKGIARAAAEEHGLAVFDGRNGKKGLLVFLQ